MLELVVVVVDGLEVLVVDVGDGDSNDDDGGDAVGCSTLMDPSSCLPMVIPLSSTYFAENVCCPPPFFIRFTGLFPPTFLLPPPSDPLSFIRIIILFPPYNPCFQWI